MLKYLPAYEGSSKIFQDLIDVEAIELDNKISNIEDFMKQLSIDTATWGLAIYEDELGIRCDINKSLEERRSVIKSKWRGTGKVDSKLIKIVAETFVNGNIEVIFNNRIILRFTDVNGIPSKTEDMKKQLDEIKPAHLNLFSRYKCPVISEIETMSIEELDVQSINDFRYSIEEIDDRSIEIIESTPLNLLAYY